MRELKFKCAGQRADGTWVISRSFTIQDIASGWPLQFVANEGDIKYIKLVYLQYTGLLDKNGNEIYEGDIIENGNGGPYHLRNMIVCWHNYHAGWALATKRENIGQWAIKMEGQSSGSEPYSNYAIVGNIYLNPEMPNENFGIQNYENTDK